MTAVPIAAIDPTRPPSRFTRAMHALGSSRAGRWYGVRVGSRIDPLLLRLSGGRWATTSFFPLVLVTVPGRRSGRERTVPLVYFTQGDEVIVIASSFGRARHPAWYLNIKANPEVELLAKGGRHTYHARETQGAERDRLFALAKQLFRGYGLYEQRATERTIPVLALKPARPS